MRRLLFGILMLTAALGVHAQVASGYSVGESGFTVQFEDIPEESELHAYIDDTLKVWTRSYYSDLDYEFIAYAVNFEGMLSITSQKDLTDYLKSFIQLMAQTYNCTWDSLYLDEGVTLPGDTSVTGVYCVWENCDNFYCDVMGWVNSKGMAITLVAMEGELPIDILCEDFHYSVVFPK